MVPQFVRFIFDGFVKLEEWVRDGKKKYVLRTTDSVAGLIYNKETDQVLLIVQNRTAMVREDNPTGRSIEVIAGRFDVKLGPKELFAKEAREEAGITLTVDDIVLLNDGVPVSLSTGVLTERCYLAYAVMDSSRVAPGDTGWGVKAEGENINRLWVDTDTFIKGVHGDLRVWAFAQFLRNELRNR